MTVLLEWQRNPAVLAVVIQGSNKGGCVWRLLRGRRHPLFAPGQQQRNPEIEDFFTEEYALNHLIHNYGKPYIAFMDGIVMGGSMGISQGAALRCGDWAHQDGHARTAIGLFPDVGGGYFLSRCPGHGRVAGADG